MMVIQKKGGGKQACIASKIRILVIIRSREVMQTVSYHSPRNHIGIYVVNEARVPWRGD